MPCGSNRPQETASQRNRLAPGDVGRRPPSPISRLGAPAHQVQDISLDGQRNGISIDDFLRLSPKSPDAEIRRMEAMFGYETAAKRGTPAEVLKATARAGQREPKRAPGDFPNLPRCYRNRLRNSTSTTLSMDSFREKNRWPSSEPMRSRLARN